MAQDKTNYQRPAKVGPGPKGSVSQFALPNPKQEAAIAAAMKGKNATVGGSKIPVHRQSNLAKSNVGR
jgi:hypothetical protein